MTAKECLEMGLYNGQNVILKITKYSSILLISVEIIFILIYLRYNRRLLKDKSFIILLHLSIVNALILLASFFVYKYQHLLCVTLLTSLAYSFETILISGMLLKSFINLLYPNYNLNGAKLAPVFCFLYFMLAMSILTELISDKCLLEENNVTYPFYISVSIIFIISAIIHNGLYIVKKGIKDCFSVKETEFLLTNIYLICALPLMIILFMIYFVDDSDFLYPYRDVAFIVYSWKPVYFFTVLYNYSTIFNVYCKKLFRRKKDNLSDRVVFNNSITIINIYNSSKI